MQSTEAQHELKLQQYAWMTTIVASQNLNGLIVTHTALAVTYLNYNFTNSVNYGGTIIQYYYET